MSNYIIMKNIDGKIVKGERKKLTSSKPYFTESDNCLTKIIDAKRLDKENSTSSKKIGKKLSDSIKTIMQDETHKKDFINLINRLNKKDFEVKTMGLIEFIEKNMNLIQSQIHNETDYTRVEYLNKINNCYLTLLDEVCDYTNEEGKTTESIFNYTSNVEVQKQIEDMKILIKEIANNSEKPDYIKSLYYQLSVSKTKNDLSRIYNQLLSKRTSSRMIVNRRNSLNNLYSKDSDLALSIMSKTIVNNYIDSLLIGLDNNELFQIEADIMNGINPIDILSQLDQSDIKNLNPEVVLFTAKLFTDTVSEKLERESKVACFDCTNGYPSRCKKVADIQKESIEDYPFIIRGFQVYRNERLDKFIVSECANFDIIPHYTKLSQKEFKKAKELLAKSFEEKINGIDPIKKSLKLIPKNKRIS